MYLLFKYFLVEDCMFILISTPLMYVFFHWPMTVDHVEPSFNTVQ